MLLAPSASLLVSAGLVAQVLIHKIFIILVILNKVKVLILIILKRLLMHNNSTMKQAKREIWCMPTSQHVAEQMTWQQQEC